MTFDPEKVTVQALLEAVKERGYTPVTARASFSVEGMTCADCVGRVERALQKTAGVLEASVNLATEKATVSYLPDAANLGQLKAAVRGAGYEVRDETTGEDPADTEQEVRGRERRRLRLSLSVAAIFSAPLMLMMVPMLVPALGVQLMRLVPMQSIFYLSFVLAPVVQFGPGRRFYRSGWPALRHGSPDMNTLVMLGTSAAYGYSVVATFLPGLLPAGTVHVYFEASAAIITLILLGKYLEARAKGRTGEAIKKLMGLQAKTAHIERGGGVLVIACPHALGLAIPLVTVNATAMSAKNGILVRNREAFERARDFKIVAFDKTGTLTEGVFGVRQVYTAGLPEDGSEDEALRLAAGLEARSEHPLGRAVADEAERRGLESPTVQDFSVSAGQGVEGTLNGRSYRIGRAEWAAGLAFPEPLRAGLDEAEARGESVIVLMDDRSVLALFALADRVRRGAKEAVRQLQKLGVEPVMITGDAEAVAATVARDLGIAQFYARVLPKDKADIVRQLKRRGQTAFVGDGINDAPALLEADLGVAIGAGTDVATESTDLVLIENDPLDVLAALKLSKATYAKMLQNLVWATGYNAVALPLAAGVLTFWGVLLSPAVGAVLMSVSTIIVAVNATLLRRVKLGGA